ncbi:MAG: hypothetical protein FIB07_04450 [Candidatus Methanoperedens sp.]|nr:hypothetical protein [Candidatus Methanoperedens sp.]
MEKEKVKGTDTWLILIWIYIVAAVYSILYGNFFLKEIIMTVAGIALLVNFIVRKRKYRAEMKADEMMKRISGISSDFAFIAAISTISILAILFDDYPSLIDTRGVLFILVAVLVVSKVACQLYYLNISKEVNY